jgi:hypothetical protein
MIHCPEPNMPIYFPSVALTGPAHALSHPAASDAQNAHTDKDVDPLAWMPHLESSTPASVHSKFSDPLSWMPHLGTSPLENLLNQK